MLGGISELVASVLAVKHSTVSYRELVLKLPSEPVSAVANWKQGYQAVTKMNGSRLQCCTQPAQGTNHHNNASVGFIVILV
jgi:hypothetical protein